MKTRKIEKQKAAKLARWFKRRDAFFGVQLKDPATISMGEVTEIFDRALAKGGEFGVMSGEGKP